MAWSCKTWKFCEQFLCILEKTTPYGKIFKIRFWKFTWWHQLTLLCSNVVKFVRREIGEIVHYSHDQKPVTLKLSLLRGLCPKSARASPQHLAHAVPDLWSHTFSHFMQHTQNLLVDNLCKSFKRFWSFELWSSISKSGGWGPLHFYGIFDQFRHKEHESEVKILTGSSFWHHFGGENKCLFFEGFYSVSLC